MENMYNLCSKLFYFPDYHLDTLFSIFFNFQFLFKNDRRNSGGTLRQKETKKTKRKKEKKGRKREKKREKERKGVERERKR